MSTSRRVHRPLTFSERSFVDPATSETIATSLALVGRLDARALRVAYDLLLQEYPVLTAAVESTGAGPVFVGGDRAHTASVGFRHTFAPWHDYAQRPPAELSALDTLCALTVTSDLERHRVTLWANHCVTDGGGLIAMTVRLFQLFAAVADGGPVVSVNPVPFPRAPHTVMAERGITSTPIPYEARLVGTSWSGRMSTADDDRTDVGHPSDGQTDDAGRVRFTRAVTAGLAAAAAALRVSTHALVSGVIGVAEQSAVPSVDPSVALLFPVDFRLRMTPPIPLAEVTALVGFSFVSTRASGDGGVPDDRAPAAIARRVHDQLRADLADGTVVRASVSPMPDPVTRRHGPPVIISNVGRFPAVDLPHCLAAEDFHSQIVRSAGGLAAYRRRWTGSGTPPVPVGSSYLVSIFDDRLSIEMRVLPGTLDPPTRRHILRRIELAVHRLSSDTTPSTNVSETMSTESLPATPRADR